MKPLKRFWHKTATQPIDGGFTISLDGKPIKTPMGRAFFAPTPPLAQAICREWDAQADTVDPKTMPLFAFVATALDRIAPQRDTVIATIAGYANSDLLCYREGENAELRHRQDATWQPYLAWLATTHGIEMMVISGVMPQPQPPKTHAQAQKLLAEFDDFHLAALHDIVTTTGSFVLGIAVAMGYASAEGAIEAALLDDLWQQEKWGYDSEADKRIKASEAGLYQAEHYLTLLKE